MNAWSNYHRVAAYNSRSKFRRTIWSECESREGYDTRQRELSVDVGKGETHVVTPIRRLRQGLQLVHLSAGLEHFLQDTWGVLGGFSDKDASG
jgi:hypothetical protein